MGSGLSPGFSCRGGLKPKRGAKNQKGRPHFKNTVLDVCSNRGAKREMGATDFKWGTGHHWPPRWRRPCCMDCNPIKRRVPTPETGLKQIGTV